MLKNKASRNFKHAKRHMGGGCSKQHLTRWGVGVLAALALATGIPAPEAHANPLDDLGNWFADTGTAVAEFFGVQPRAGSLPEEYTVPTVNPTGTTINLFDYWTDDAYETVEQDENDYNRGNDINQGISAGHDLKFLSSGGTDFNAYQYGIPFGYSTDRRGNLMRDNEGGVVANRLQGGFPVLNQEATNSSESLAYLFNSYDVDTQGSDRVEGKRAYTDVKGLLQVDADGYYYYNSGSIGTNTSEGNYAEFIPNESGDSGSFAVYNQRAVNYFANNSWTRGMFFPFTPAERVLEESIWGNTLQPVDTYSDRYGAQQNGLNHYFGLTMTTRFMQLPDGMSLDGRTPITYEFTGDDDVFVFIDDVLVGDLGGIHDACTLSINFSTGDILVNGDNVGTIREWFRDAGVANSAEWNGNTFADNTLHTLKFFYLERGNVASNMRLKTNLFSVPETEIVKVTQDGQPIAGIDFTLYASDATYSDGSLVEVCSGTTESDGTLVLKNGEDELITFNNLYEKNGYEHYVLREKTGSASGGLYRKTGDMHLRYISEGESNPELGTGFIVSDNYKETGAFANARESVSVDPTSLRLQTALPNGSTTVPVSGGQIQGTLFAVPLKVQGKISDTNDLNNADWKGVYGTSADGWELGDGDNLTSAINAAKGQSDYKTDAFIFLPNPNGMYQVDIEELPGNIEEYFYALDDAEVAKTKYALAFYYTSADTVAGATTDNTRQVVNSGFTRQFAAQLNISNIYNDFIVEKVDQDGNPIDGATFGLYDADSATYDDATGLWTINEDATPIVERKTGEMDDPAAPGGKRQGVVLFEGMMDTGVQVEPVLLTGNYYFIAETDAPDGYAINPNATRIYVSDEAIFIDAGVEDDGVRVMRGVGKLVSTMDQFAENSAIDASLTDIVSTLYTNGGKDIDASTELAQGWNEAKEDDGKTAKDVHLNYSMASARQEYAPDKSEGDNASPVLTSDTDWTRLKITQCLNGNHGVSDDNKEYFTENEQADGTPLDLNMMFSGLAIIEVTDPQVNDLEVTKTVNGYTGMSADKLAELRENAEFTFNATFTEPVDVADPDGSRQPLSGEYVVKILDEQGDPVQDNGQDVTFPIEADDQSKVSKVEFTLKHGQTAKVEGLPVEVEYEVAEAEPTGAKYTTEATVNGDGEVDEKNSRRVTGSLADGDSATADVVEPVVVAYINTYDLQPYGTEIEIPVVKRFVDSNDENVSEWKKDTTFVFQMFDGGNNSGVMEKNPMPKGWTGGMTAQLNITSTEEGGLTDRKGAFVFDGNSFTAPGDYKYFLSEVLSENALPGVYYSKARYVVTVSVTDNGNGGLDAKVSYARSLNDLGQGDNDVPYTGDPLFINTHTENSANFSINAFKTVTMYGAERVPETGKFSFTLTPEGGTKGADTRDANDVPTPDGTKGQAKTVTNTGFLVGFGGIEFGENDAGWTYTYTLKEIPGTEAGWNYESNVYRATVKVTQDGAEISASAVYTMADDANTSIDADHLYTDGQGNKTPIFINTYDVSPISVPFAGAKTITGPWSGDASGFEFTLSLVNADPADGVAWTDSIKVMSASGGSISFGEIQFKKPGTYEFSVSETPRTTGGWTSDAAAHTVTVEVTDTNGVLNAEFVDNSDDALDFTNTYAASAEVTVAGSKTLTGRGFKPTDEFTFDVDVTAEHDNNVIQNPPMPSLAPNGSVVLKNLNAATQSPVPFNFGTITFTQPGKYTYTFSEQEPAGDDKQGMNYDKTKYEVKFEVEDNQNGKLGVTMTTDAQGVTFDAASGALTGLAWTNTYAPGETTLGGAANLAGTKSFTGREWNDNDEFTFKLEPYGAMTQAAVAGDADAGIAPTVFMPNETELTVKKGDADADGNAKFEFGDIRFTKATTYGNGHQFKVSEVIPGDATSVQHPDLMYKEATDAQRKSNTWRLNGITYDNHEAILRVAVQDDGNGKLTASVVNQPSLNLTWNNVYSATVPTEDTAKTNVVFTKVFTGREWAASDEFVFQLKGLDGAPMPDNSTGDIKTVPVNGQGSKLENGAYSKDFSFGTIEFTMDMVEGEPNRTKKFVYEVTELEPSGDAIAGVAYDDSTATITITVTDNGSGTLSATTVVTGDKDPQVFTNTYRSGSVDLGNLAALKIVKKLKDRDIAKDEFEFTMTADNDDAKAKVQSIEAFTDGVKTFKTAGAVMVGDIATETIDAGAGLVFNLDDAGKDFIFKVAETHPEEGADQGHVHNGVTYDDREYTLKFEVRDNGAGTLTVTAYVDDAVDPAAQWTDTVQPAAVTDTVVTLEFNNSYDPGEVIVGGTGIELAATKKLTGRPLEDGEFKFDVVNSKDTSNAVVCTGSNDATGKISFPAIEYDIEKLIADNAAQPQLNSLTTLATGEDVYTYTYNVKEQAVTQGGMTADDDSSTFTVKITDDHKGALKGEVSYSADEADGMVFTNTYNAADASLTISGMKSIASSSNSYTPEYKDIADAYTFKLAASTPGAPMPAAGGEIAKMDANTGDIEFGEIVYTLDNVWPEGTAVAAEDEAVADSETPVDTEAGTEPGSIAQDEAELAAEPAPAAVTRTKTFTYTVTEEGGLPYIENDAANPKTVEVTVTDNGDGTLTAKTGAPANVRDFTFTNTYKSTPGESSVTVDGGFVINKELKGRDLKPEEFSFELKSTDGAFEPVIAKNNAEGKVEFPAMTFTKAGVYKFVLSEVNNGLGGVTYSDATYNVTATVVDNHQGALAVEWTVDGHKAGDELTFVNTYEADPTSIVFNAAKVLKGRDLKDGEFEFTLSENGKVLQTVKNDANGQIAFEWIEYTEPGEHEYVIAEVKGDVKGVTYDDAKYTVKVSVTDGGKGLLLCDWAYGEAGAPVFTNVYTEDKEPPKPEPPKPEPPKTDGDKGDKETLPATGDASMLLAVPAIAGAAATAAGIYTSKRKRNRS